jgi:hypothetical protein
MTLLNFLLLLCLPSPWSSNILATAQQLPAATQLEKSKLPLLQWKHNAVAAAVQLNHITLFTWQVVMEL